MQPQTPTAPVSSPSPNPQYDFILRDPTPPKRGLGLPSLPKPILLLAGAVGLLIIVIVVAVIVGGGKTSNSQQLVVVVGQAQEIARVSTLVQQESQDPNTQYLAATAQTALSSEQYQLTTYLSSHGITVSPTQLALYMDKTTDTKLNAAQLNNSLGNAYASYLKNAISTYQTSLNAAAQGASKNSLAILSDANSSAKVILAAPEIATSQQ
jgi:hypothetical protein